MKLAMKHMGLAVAFASSVMVGCNDRKEAGSVGTSGAGYDTPAASAISSSDKDFVNDLTIAGMAEVELGKLAQTNGAVPDVKTFGKMMVDDHTAAGEKLKAVVDMHKIPAPAALDEKHQDLYNKLSALHGAAFDREYTDAMVKGHEEVLGKLEARIDKVSLSTWKKVMDALPGNSTPTAQPPAVIAETSDDPATMSLNQWAAAAYPTVYKHLQTAKATYTVVTHAPKSTQ